MADTGLPARRSALYLLERIQTDGKLMAELLAEGALDRLSPPDRARAQRLANDVLRQMDRADRIIARHAKKAPPLPIHNILRLGAVELSQGGASHGIVNDLVELAARSKRHGRLKGLVNAVLRKLADDIPQTWGKLPIPALPKWLRKPLVQAWGNSAVQKLETVQSGSVPLDITARGDAAEWADKLGGRLLETGSIRLHDYGQVSLLPGLAEGAWWVQDAAAAIPAKLIKGQNVIDLCAAPGGKTMQMAAAGHVVTAVDNSEKRSERLRANLDRTGLSADIRISDARQITGTWDAVLLDAPCSATGTLRRHPDLPYAKDGSDFLGLFQLQKQLIDHAITLLPAGGQLVYCTCSLLPDEGEVQIEDALARHEGLSIDAEAMATDWIDPSWRSSEGGLRLRPDMWADRGGIDGFYICALRKAA